MEKDLLKIIKHYGVNNQLRKLQEEVDEVKEAIIILQNRKLHDIEGDEIDNIKEELADVMVMLCQFKEYYHIDGKEIMEIMKQKINRTLNKINKEDT